MSLHSLHFGHLETVIALVDLLRREFWMTEGSVHLATDDMTLEKRHKTTVRVSSQHGQSSSYAG
jgi:hypothetical protein